MPGHCIRIVCARAGSDTSALCNTLPFDPLSLIPLPSFFFSAEGYVDTDVKLQKILAGILAAQTI